MTRAELARPSRKQRVRTLWISDVHLGPLPRLTFRELASKRITGYVNWHRNRRKHLFAGALDMLLADIETRQFVYANQAICQMFGYSPTEFEKLSPIHLHPDYETERVIAAFEGMLEGNTTRLHNLDSLHKNGSIFIDQFLYRSFAALCVLHRFYDVGK